MNRAMITGTTTIGTHAPMVNLVMATMSSTTKVADAPDAVDDHAPPPARFPLAQVVAHHARLAEREGGEHADGVERDEGVGDAAEGDDEHAGGDGEEEDAVGEHEAVAPVGELAGQVAVPGDDRRQPGEVGVGGVGGQDEDAGGGELQDARRTGSRRTPPGPSARSPSRRGSGTAGGGWPARHAEEQRAEDGRPSTSGWWRRSSTRAGGRRARRWRWPRRR